MAASENITCSCSSGSSNLKRVIRWIEMDRDVYNVVIYVQIYIIIHI